MPSRRWILAAAAVVAAVTLWWRPSLVGRLIGLMLGPAAEARWWMAERRRLDRTVWADEVAAQEYEAAAVALWDGMRAFPRPWTVLRETRLGAVTLGVAAGRENLGRGIVRTRYRAGGRKLAPAAWDAAIRGLEARGVAFVQGELHHARFEPARAPSAAAARSLFSVVAHLAGPAAGGRARRIMIEARVWVTWGPLRDERGLHVPESVAVADARATEWTGPPAFREVLAAGASGAAQERLSAYPLVVYDLDGDGDSDLLLPRLDARFVNQGGMRFRRTSLFADPPPGGTGDVTAATAADFTGDGVTDLFLVRSGADPWLVAGRGDGSFAPPDTVHVPGARWENALCATAGDVNGDGLLDLWIGQYRPPYDESLKEYPIPTRYYDANDSFPSYLLVNAGRGRFQDASREAGLAGRRRRTFSASLVDLDGDGALDLLTVSDFAGVDAYLNDGRGRFREATRRVVDQRHLFGMAHTIGDYDLDGNMDLYVIGMSSTTAKRLTALGLGRRGFPGHQRMRPIMGYGNRMLLGDGRGRYRQAPWNDDVAATGWSWGATTLDVDLDGWSDLYVCNGNLSGPSAKDYCTVFWRHDIYEEAHPAVKRRLFLQTVRPGSLDAAMSWNGFEHNVLYLNRGRRFDNVAFLLDVAFQFDARCAVSDDLDLDGRPDLVVVERGGRGRMRVLRNEWPDPGAWIGVRLKEAPRVPPQGALIRVFTPRATKSAWIVSGDSFACQHPAARVFGLGSDPRVDAIEVRWTGGRTRRLVRPAAGRYHDLAP